MIQAWIFILHDEFPPRPRGLNSPVFQRLSDIVPPTFQYTVADALAIQSAAELRRDELVASSQTYDTETGTWDAIGS